MKSQQHFSGEISFLAKYVYGMQTILQPLNNLSHKENEFRFTKEHYQIFDEMKRAITNRLEITIPDKH